MRLHRIRLENFRGTLEREVEFDDRGLHIIEGPNEIGKSSIVEALDLLLSFKSSSSHGDVLAVQRSGADVPVVVEAEFTIGGDRVVYRKSFVRKKGTELRFVDGVRESLTGDDAHNRFDEMLDASVDRPLWKALRMAQDVPIAQLGVDEKGKVASLATLHQALDAAADGADPAGDDGLIDQVRRHVEEFWTAGRKPRGEYKRAIDELAAAQAQVDEAVDQLRRVQTTIDEYDRTVATLRDKQEKLREVEGDLEAFATAQKAVDQAGRRLEEARANRAERLGAEREARRLVETRRQIVGRADEAARARAEADERLAGIGDRVDAADTMLAEARTALETAESDAEAAAAAVDAARAAQDRKHLEARLARIEEVEAELETKERAHGDVAIDSDTVEKIAEAKTALSALEVKRTASAPRVDIAGSGQVRIGDAEVDAAAGWSDAVVDTTRFEVGEVSLTVFPAGDTAALRDEYEREHARVRQLLEKSGVAGLDEARSRLRESDELVGEIKNLRSRREDMLATRTVDELRAELAALPEPGDEEEPGDVDTASERAHAAAARTRKAREDEREAASRVAAVRETLAARTSGAEAAGEAFAAADRELVEARATTPDADLETRAEKAAAESADAEAAYLDAEHAHASASAAAPADTIAHVTGVHDSLGEEIGTLKNTAATLSERLRNMGEDGVATRHAKADSHLDDVERVHASIDRRARAALVLLDALEARRRDAMLRYQAPFRAKVVELGTRVFGPDFDIELDENLLITHRRLDGVTVPYSALSSGAKEQLAIIVRVACAAFVGDGGVPIFLDDTLGYTDPIRRKDIGHILALSGQESQVIVLTCDSRRFDDAGAARRVRLSENQL